MKSNRILILLLSLSFTICQAQLDGLLKKAKNIKTSKVVKSLDFSLFEEEKLDYPTYQNHIGEVCFSNEEFERSLPESKLLKTYTLGDKITMRAWMKHSPANSMLLQLKEMGKNPLTINSNKNSFEYQSKVIFVVYLDGQKIGNTSHAMKFKESDMTSLATHRADLNDKTDTSYFGEGLYQDLLGNPQLLTTGMHKLKIELLPYKTTGYGSDVTYSPIAVGEIDMIVPDNINLSQTDCFPKNKYNDKTLENEVIKSCEDYFENDGTKVLKVIFPFNSLDIARNEFGIILKKYFTAVVITQKGDEISANYFDFNKNYDGVEYMDAVFRGSGHSNPPKRIIHNDCLQFIK